MKSIRFRVMLAGLAVLMGTMIARSQTADMAAPPPPHGPGFEMGEHMLQYYTKALNLTDEQQAQAKTMLQNAKPSMKALFQQQRQIDQQLHGYAEGTYDAKQVQALAQQKGQIEAQMEVARTQLHNQLYQLLTPDQQSQLKQLEAQRKAEMQQRWQQHSQQEGPPAPPAD